MSVRWFAEQDEEEGDMENINHFLIFHPEVSWGVRVKPKLNRACAASPRLLLPAFVDSGRRIRGMTQGKAWLCDCPKAAFPGAARGDRWCGAPQFPGRGSPTLHQTLDCRRWDNEFKGDIILH